MKAAGTLTRRQQRILDAMAKDGGQTITMRRAFPAPARYRLGADYLDEADVRRLVERGLIAPVSVKPDAYEIIYRITAAGCATVTP